MHRPHPSTIALLGIVAVFVIFLIGLSDPLQQSVSINPDLLKSNGVLDRMHLRFIALVIGSTPVLANLEFSEAKNCTSLFKVDDPDPDIIFYHDFFNTKGDETFCMHLKKFVEKAGKAGSK